ncbi:MAG: biotin--[acetyl-CoA-carboxylase] ligase [Firmicutes bacterium]|nr:biotin--[acetyl-CoA-carboxylase] ligase [Bacillota bacterium]
MNKNNSREKILKQLKDCKGQFISGTDLSKNTDTSRAAIWKQIERLREEGYEISSVTNRGYRLDTEPDFLDSRLLIENRIICKHSVDSTNREARILAESGAPGYSVIAAEEQLQGRGRLGRHWFSPPKSGIWFSIILRPEHITPEEVTPVTLVTAVSIAAYFREIHNLQVQVKWPNDLLINSKKFGGVLTELKGEPDRIEYIIVGIGLNISQNTDTFPTELKERATSLFIESGKRHNRTYMLVEIYKALVNDYKLFFSNGFSPFYKKWKYFSSTLGQQVTISRPGGSLTGRAVNLSEKGALIIEDNTGKTHYLNFGEIT